MNSKLFKHMTTLQKMLIGGGIVIVLGIIGGYIIMQERGSESEYTTVLLDDPFAFVTIPETSDLVLQERYEETVSGTKAMYLEKPDEWATWNAIGNMYLMFQQYDYALSAYEYALKDESSDFVTYNNIAKLYEGPLNNNQKAAESYEKAIADYPIVRSFYIDLGRLYYYRMNMPEKAEEVFTQGLTQVSDNTDIIIQLIELYKKEGQDEKMKEQVEILLEKYPDNEQYKEEWGYILN